MSFLVGAVIAGLIGAVVAEHYKRTKIYDIAASVFLGWATVWIFAHLRSKGWSRVQALFPAGLFCIFWNSIFMILGAVAGHVVKG